MQQQFKNVMRNVIYSNKSRPDAPLLVTKTPTIPFLESDNFSDLGKGKRQALKTELNYPVCINYLGNSKAL